MHCSGQEEFFRQTETDLHNFFQNPKLEHTETVYLDNCMLEAIPFKKGSLRNLKSLNLSNNKLNRINHKHFKSPTKLENLVIDNNPIKIIHIEKLKSKFPELKSICAGSKETRFLSPPVLEAAARKENALTVEIVSGHAENMKSPPAEVLQGGSEKVRSYIALKSEKTSGAKFDMKHNNTKNVLMLLGKPEAGKTSLLTTVREGETAFTTEYQRTIILERSNLPLTPNITISAYDFGAQDIYEIEYPIFLRNQNVIALIVIDAYEYEPEAHDEIVTRWLSNCVLCSECKVVFVLSKCDRLKPETVASKKSSLSLKITSYINKEIEFLEKEEASLKKSKGEGGQLDRKRIKQSVDFFRSLQQNITITTTSAYTQTGLERLKLEITKKIDSKEAANLPLFYGKVIHHILQLGSRKRYHVLFDEGLTYLTEEMKTNSSVMAFFKRKWQRWRNSEPDTRTILHSILDFYRRKGWVLWYETSERYIYVNVNDILEVHRKLYRHDLDKFLTYNFEKHHNIIDNKITFDEHKDNFLFSGLLSTEILKCLWKEFDLNSDDFQSMVELLMANDHCFVDPYDSDGISSAHVYKFPWFIQHKMLEAEFWENNWPEWTPLNTVEFNLKYTFFSRLPATIYERISVRLHNVTKTQGLDRRDWKNGVYIGRGKMKLLLQRHIDLEDPELSIKFRGPCDNIDEIWDWCCKIYKDVLNKLIEQNEIVTYVKTFVCPHCILTRCSFEDSQHYQISDVLDSVCDIHGQISCKKSGTLVPAAYSQPLLPSKIIFYIVDMKGL